MFICYYYLTKWLCGGWKSHRARTLNCTLYFIHAVLRARIPFKSFRCCRSTLPVPDVTPLDIRFRCVAVVFGSCARSPHTHSSRFESTPHITQAGKASTPFHVFHPSTIRTNPFGHWSPRTERESRRAKVYIASRAFFHFTHRRTHSFYTQPKPTNQPLNSHSFLSSTVWRSHLALLCALVRLI